MKGAPLQTIILKRMIPKVTYTTKDVMELHGISYTNAQTALKKLHLKHRVRKEIVNGRAIFKR